jgi:Nuclease-related domain
MATVSVMVDEPASLTDAKRMRLRYAGTCVRCGTSLATGTTADYDRASKMVACPPRRALPGEAAGSAPPRLAAGQLPTLEVVDGHGGASATVEFQRRHDKRQERVLTNHPRIGRFLLAVFDDPQSTRAWSVGAEGERMLSEMLQSIAGESLRVLNDRRIPGTKANIDHLVVCPSGVFVVDAKRYRNSRPELRVEGGLFRPRTELLYVAGRDRPSLVEGMHKQVALVRAALVDQPEVPVRGVLCFVDADWPLIGGAFTVNEVAVLGPKKLKALLTESGPVDQNRIADLQWQLHEAFPRQKQAPPAP